MRQLSEKSLLSLLYVSMTNHIYLFIYLFYLSAMRRAMRQEWFM